MDGDVTYTSHRFAYGYIRKPVGLQQEDGLSEVNVAPRALIDSLKHECWCGHPESNHKPKGISFSRHCRVEGCHCWRFRSRVDIFTGNLHVDKTDRPVCPWCANIVEDYWDYGLKFEDESKVDITCGSCEKIFTIRINISYDFTSEVKEGSQ